MEIEKKLITKNYTAGRSGEKIKYIVIHDTGNTSKGADAEAHFRYFDSENRNASAHYFVDDKRVIQVIDDKDTAWHCGKLYSDSVNNPECKNKNSIGIELCINSDGDYEKAYRSMIELTKHLMSIYQISDEYVIRHYDACKKICPASFSKNNWAKWFEFKEILKGESHSMKEVVQIRKKEQKFIVKGKEETLSVLETQGYNYVSIREIAKLLNIEVYFDEQNNVVELK